MPKPPKAAPKPAKAEEAKGSTGAVLGPTGTSELPRYAFVNQAPEPMLPEPAQRCVALWASVISRAVSDSYGRDLPPSQRETDERRPGLLKRVARAWLRQPSVVVLEAAGVEPEAWPIALRYLEASWKVLDESRRKARECAASM